MTAMAMLNLGRGEEGELGGVAGGSFTSEGFVPFRNSRRFATSPWSVPSSTLPTRWLSGIALIRLFRKAIRLRSWWWNCAVRLATNVSTYALAALAATRGERAVAVTATMSACERGVTENEIPFLMPSCASAALRALDEFMNRAAVTTTDEPSEGW